jgi:2-polyprenyl-6-methoxyphenol hydroxylase-like FAD-dependent oxidoreductase
VDGEGEKPIDLLIVGAGPTGLTLAAQLSSFGVRFRIVDQAPTAAHESRALAVQARTLEILQSLGLGEAL